MIIILDPIVGKDETFLDVEGSVITLNGVVYDFSPMKDGDELPTTAITSNDFPQSLSVKHENGQLTVPIQFSISTSAPYESRFPKPIVITEDGPVELPPYMTVEEVGEIPIGPTEDEVIEDE